MREIEKGNLIEIDGLGMGIVMSTPIKSKRDGTLVADMFWIRAGAFLEENEKYTEKEYLGGARIIAD